LGPYSVRVLDQPRSPLWSAAEISGLFLGRRWMRRLGAGPDCYEEIGAEASSIIDCMRQMILPQCFGKSMTSKLGNTEEAEYKRGKSLLLKGELWQTIRTRVGKSFTARTRAGKRTEHYCRQPPSVERSGLPHDDASLGRWFAIQCANDSGCWAEPTRPIPTSPRPASKETLTWKGQDYGRQRNSHDPSS